jgi:ABC-2 type transport system ATP-binding protein
VATLIEAKGLTKTYGSMRALDAATFAVEAGRIVGLIGPNGAGKTTALKAILGLTRCEGSLRVLGLDPHAQRAELMQNVSFIADVAVLPRWLKVQQAIDFVAGVHPRFRRDRCEEFLARTNVKRTSRVKELSKGMITQLHLALVMAIDAKLLVLDEPTLGLDILSRKQFYDSLLNDYMDAERTILVTTHQVEEIETILTDLIFIDRGKVVLDMPMESIPERYVQLLVPPDRAAAARELKPLTERQLLGRHVFLYEDADGAQLERLGEVRQPSIADLFVAKVHGAELRAAGAVGGAA